MTDHEIVWQHLSEPPSGHPDQVLIWEAEQALQSISELAENPDIRNAFVKRLDELRSGLDSAARLLLGMEHNIAFIGDIGVGKSTALCRVVGLEMPVLGESIPVLETGGGGTTICEVHIVNGQGYGLDVEARSEDELRREVHEFARLMMPVPESGADDDTVAREVVRAIRNMSGLQQERLRNPDGTISGNVDPVRALAEGLASVDDLADKIWDKMEHWRRTGRELRYPDVSDTEPLPWLQENFKKLNYGQHPEFSLPKRIDVILPESILGDETLSIRIVDTKGIDGTAEREDLSIHLNEPSTISVLCSSFNDAPTTSVQRLLERAQEGAYPDLETKSAILVLPRSGEARAVKDDFGDTVGTAPEGYDLKKDQAQLGLRTANLPNVPVGFFDVFEDDRQRFREFLLELVASLRKMHRERLEEVIIDALALLDNYEDEQVREVQRQAARHLETWLTNNQEIGRFSTELQASLFQAIRVGNASSLRASVRRKGQWLNLDYPHQLSFGARALAASVVTPKLNEFRAIVKFLLQNSDLLEASGLLREASRIIESGTEVLFGRIQLIGRDVHTEFMEPDEIFWDGCNGEWGQGPGYKNRVAARHERWFEGDPHQIAARTEEKIQTEWQALLERVGAILVSDEDDD